MAKDINELLNTDVEAIVAEGQKGFKRTQKKAILAIMIFIAVCAIAAGAYFVFQQVHSWQSYNYAVELMEAGKYDEAKKVFGELDNYKDSADMSNEIEYRKARDLLSEGKYDSAIERFEKLGEYKDSNEMVKESNYQKANAFLKDGNAVMARTLYIELDSYKDSKKKTEILGEQIYNSAISFVNSEKYESAIELFEKISDYRDSNEQKEKALTGLEKLKKYEEVKSWLEYNMDIAGESDFEKVYKMFLELGDYKDSEEYANKFSYVLLYELEEGESESGTRSMENYRLCYNSAGQIEGKKGYTGNLYEEWKFIYDKNGLLIKKVSSTEGFEEREVHEYIYDETNQVIEMREKSNPFQSDYVIHRYIYDVNGNCVEETINSLYSDSITHIYYTYNDEGLCTSESYHSGSGTTETSYYYDFNDKGDCIKKTGKKNTYNNRYGVHTVTTTYTYGYVYTPDKQ